MSQQVSASSKISPPKMEVHTPVISTLPFGILKGLVEDKVSVSIPI